MSPSGKQGSYRSAGMLRPNQCVHGHARGLPDPR